MKVSMTTKSSADFAAEALALKRASFRTIVNANIPAKVPERDSILEGTMAFLDKLQHLSTKQVKELTLMRLKNGNVDPELVPEHKLSAEALADALDAHYHVDGFLVLKQGEVIKSPAAAMEM
jgi:hypothetical protein